MVQAGKSMLRFYVLTSPSNESNLLVICVDMQITLPRTFRSSAPKLDSSVLAQPRWTAAFPGRI